MVHNKINTDVKGDQQARLIEENIKISSSGFLSELILSHCFLTSSIKPVDPSEKVGQKEKDLSSDDPASDDLVRFMTV